MEIFVCKRAGTIWLLALLLQLLMFICILLRKFGAYCLSFAAQTLFAICNSALRIFWKDFYSALEVPTGIYLHSSYQSIIISSIVAAIYISSLSDSSRQVE